MSQPAFDWTAVIGVIRRRRTSLTTYEIFLDPHHWEQGEPDRRTALGVLRLVPARTGGLMVEYTHLRTLAELES